MTVVSTAGNATLMNSMMGMANSPGMGNNSAQTTAVPVMTQNIVPRLNCKKGRGSSVHSPSRSSIAGRFSLVDIVR